VAIPVLVIIDLAPSAVARLEESGFEVFIASQHGGRDQAVKSTSHARAVITNGSLGLTATEIEALPNLEYIHAVGAGFEMIDIDAASARNIPVTNGSGTNSRAVADHAMTLLLASASTLLPSHAAVLRGEWGSFSSPQRDAALIGDRPDFPHRRAGISGKKLGILGLGVIGREIARRAANGFDMEVAYHNRRPVEGVPYIWESTLENLARWSDFLVVSAPGGPETHHLINDTILDALGPAGYLVNTGRGTIVDTEALIDALESRRIAGAALDVVEGEPNIPPRLLAAERIILTPHMAGRTEESFNNMMNLATSNLEAWFAGGPLRNRLN
jgi:lactate dehydrogenase-like 2-hydroxyacid dehydrogenase